MADQEDTVEKLQGKLDGIVKAQEELGTLIADLKRVNTSLQTADKKAELETVKSTEMASPPSHSQATSGSQEDATFPRVKAYLASFGGKKTAAMALNETITSIGPKVSYVYDGEGISFQCTCTISQEVAIPTMSVVGKGGSKDSARKEAVTGLVDYLLGANIMRGGKRKPDHDESEESGKKPAL